MRHVLCHIVLLCSFALGVLAQEAQEDSVQATKRLYENSFSAELLGNSVLLSVNYERFIADNLSIRLGVGPFPLSTAITLNTYIPAKNEHSLELGAGYVFAWFSSRGVDYRPFAVARVGYNYQATSGFLFRATFIPTFSYPDGFLFPYPEIISIPRYCCDQFSIGTWFGISLGWGF